MVHHVCGTCAQDTLKIVEGHVQRVRLSASIDSAMLQINIAMASGRTENFSLLPSSKVGDLRILAQKLFGQGFLRLITEEGRALTDPSESLESAGIQDGDHITALVLQVKIAATAGAFALWRSGGDTVLTWGSAHHGCDSSTVQEQFKGVQQVEATGCAFAADLEGGSVVTWGVQEYRGDSSAVQDQLKNAKRFHTTGRAFAASLEDGSVVTWGDPDYGGDSSAVQDRLKTVHFVTATEFAFAAILADGSVVT